MPSLTQKRRSQLLEALMQEVTRPPSGIRTGGEAAARVMTKFLQKKYADRLAEEEKAAEAQLADALTNNAMIGTPGGGSVTSTPGEAIAGDTGDPFTITKKERGTQPGKAINENALAEVLALPPGLREQGLAALQAVTAMQPEAKEPPNLQRSVIAGEATEDIAGADGQLLARKGQPLRIQEVFNPRSGAYDYMAKIDGQMVSLDSDQFQSDVQRTEDATPKAPDSKLAAWAEDIALLDEDLRKTELLLSIDPEEFLTYYARGKKGLLDFADKLGLADEESRQWLQDAQTFKGLTEQIFQGIRREVTGAQAAKIELDVLEQAFLSTKMGPSQYRAALTLIGEMQQGIRDVKQSLIDEGITPDDNPGLYARRIDRALAKYSGAGSAFNDKVKNVEDSGNPAGIDQAIWDAMTPEEKALFE